MFLKIYWYEYCSHLLDRLESKLRRLQKSSLQSALSERKSDEARRFLDARLEGLDYISSASTQYSEVAKM